MDSSVDIATYNNLEDPEIEYRCRRDFLHLFRLTLGPTQPPTQGVPHRLRGVKQTEPGVNHPPPTSAEVKGRVQLYLFSPYVPLWQVIM